MQQYFQGQANQFLAKYHNQLGKLFDQGEDTKAFTPQKFLDQQDFGNTFAGLPPEVAGRLQGRFNPFTQLVQR